MNSHTSLHSRPSRHLCLILVSTMLSMGLGPAMAENTTPAQSQSQSGSGIAPKPRQLPQIDQVFLRQAQQACVAAVQGSKLALDRSTNTQVRNFAQRVLEKHTHTRSKLDALAEAKGVDIPESPSLTQRAKLAILSMREGRNFDQDYVESVGVAAHQDTIELFQKAVANTNDPDVRAFATDTLPELQHDLDVAKTLQATTLQEESDK